MLRRSHTKEIMLALSMLISAPRVLRACQLLLALGLTFLTSHAALAAESDGDIVKARIAVFSAKLQDQHPRLLLKPEELSAFKQFATQVLPREGDGGTMLKQLIPAIDGKALPAQPLAVSNGTQEGSQAWREGYNIANDTGNMAWRYALAWQLTGEQRYGREAARWLLHLASWKIDAEVLRTNDELFIQHLRPMIFAYDWAWNALTPEERTTVRAALTARLQLLADRIQPKFSLSRPSAPDNSLSHPLRFISTLGLGGLALYHESSAAPAWLAWSYEYYLRQFPVWGGDAGGWAEGLNYWSTGMTQHLRFLEAMQLLGFDDVLQRPFFRNTAWFASYFQQPYAASSFGDLTNVMAPSPSMAMLVEKFALLLQDPYLYGYAHTLNPRYPSGFSYYEFNAIDTLLQVFRTRRTSLQEIGLKALPASRYFDDIGWVAMHSNFGDKANDIMLGFKSSPYGSASHSFADQNSFVINAFGEPLAISSGYREWYDSPHHKGWTRSTAAKNAILINGEGQPIKSAAARGRITRFVQGEHFTFTTGDAREAYSQQANQALRHVFFVDKRYFVMLDELSAKAPAQFQWLLHARDKMNIDASHNSIGIARNAARLDVQLFWPAPGQLAFKQTDAFTPPVAPGYEQRMPNEWHVSASTLNAARDQAFFSLLYPHRADVSAEDASARSLPASRGFALALTRDGKEDRVYIARQDEQRIRAEGIEIDGAAGWIGKRDEQEAQLVVVAARRLKSNWLSLDADRPLDIDISLKGKIITLDISQPQATTLRVSQATAPRSVTGVNPADWRYDSDNNQIVFDLSPQTRRITITQRESGSLLDFKF
ncbi:hypothetical protein GCM10028811_32210 [Uliginosibacterium sediminicola]